MRLAAAALVLLAGLAPAGARGEGVSSDSLRALAEAKIRSALGPLSEGCSLECRPLLTPDPIAEDSSLEIVALLSDPRPASLMTPVVRVLRGARVERSIPIPFRLRLTGPRLHAARALAKGEPLTTEGVRAEVEELPIPWDDPLTDPSQALGLVLRRAVGPGEILRSDLLEQPVLVRSGDPVVLELESTTVRILARGTARGSVRLGDTIAVVRDGERRRLRAVVTAHGFVRVAVNSLPQEILELSRSSGSPEPEGAAR